jgi:hypothetical protein
MVMNEPTAVENSDTSSYIITELITHLVQQALVTMKLLFSVLSRCCTYLMKKREEKTKVDVNSRTAIVFPTQKERRNKIPAIAGDPWPTCSLKAATWFLILENIDLPRSRHRVPAILSRPFLLLHVTHLNHSACSLRLFLSTMPARGCVTAG